VQSSLGSASLNGQKALFAVLREKKTRERRRAKIKQFMDSRRSKSAPRPGRASTQTVSIKNSRSKQRKIFLNDAVPLETPRAQNAVRIRIHALRLADWNTIDRALLQTILCKRTAASYVASYSQMLMAEVGTNRHILVFDWGCLCIVDEGTQHRRLTDQQEEEALNQYIDFLLNDVIYVCSSSDIKERVKPSAEDQDSITLLFAGVRGRKNRIENDVMFLEPTDIAEDRRKLATACSFALSQSLSLRSLELELQDWCAEQLNPLTIVLAESGDVPDEEVTLRLYGRLYGFLDSVDAIGPALDTPADLEDSDTKAVYSEVYEYLEVEGRLKIMHERFDIFKASLSLFKSLLESSESTRKERIIIYLLVVCVCIAGLELLAKIYRHL
jgi:uncharacterized Rmd1/YagE family protein